MYSLIHDGVVDYIPLWLYGYVIYLFYFMKKHFKVL